MSTVRFNCANSEAEPIRDLRVRAAQDEQAQHRQLTTRKAIGRYRDIRRLSADAGAEPRVQTPVAINRSLHCLHQLSAASLSTLACRRGRPSIG